MEIKRRFIAKHILYAMGTTYTTIVEVIETVNGRFFTALSGKNTNSLTEIKESDFRIEF